MFNFDVEHIYEREAELLSFREKLNIAEKTVANIKKDWGSEDVSSNRIGEIYGVRKKVVPEQTIKA